MPAADPRIIEDAPRHFASYGVVRTETIPVPNNAVPVFVAGAAIVSVAKAHERVAQSVQIRKRNMKVSPAAGGQTTDHRRQLSDEFNRRRNQKYPDDYRS
jgi:hypothetical protein